MSETIKDMVDHTGRVNYRRVSEYIARYAIQYFVDQIKHPLLVGKDLYEGEVLQNLAPNQTLRFNQADLKDMAEGKDTAEFEANSPRSITHAIYMMRKKPFSGGMPNVISIGRSAENDITIVDYVVSKRHAQIIIFHGMYFVVDNGSTNGTRINGKLIEPNVKTKIAANDNIAFGRLIFVFTAPADLYHGLKSQTRK